VTEGKYDVISVGSGIGGLGAGAVLAYHGYKTLVVEKSNRIGGRYSTNEVEGFKLPTGAMTIHRGGPGDEIFKQVGVDIDLLPVPPLSYRIGDKDYVMPAKGSVSVMLDIINKLEVNRVKLAGGLIKAAASEKIMGGFRKSIGESEKQNMTFRDWLLQYTDNEMAHSVFDSMACSMLGGHTYELTARQMFGWFVKMGGRRDVGVARYGNEVEMQKLVKVVEEKGGDVWTNCQAKRIVVEGGRAKGLVVEKDGKEIEVGSQVVISNAGPRKTVEMAGQENFDEDYMRMMRLRVKPHPVLVCYVGGNRPLWPESEEAAILMVSGAIRMHAVVPMGTVATALNPPGQYFTYVQFHPLTSFLPMNKEEERKQALIEMDEQFPGWQNHQRILYMEAMDITDELAEMHSQCGSEMPYETPVKGLYNVGDGCMAFGYTGSTAAAYGALQVVEKVEKSIKPQSS
jgi:phytoene dehydrogenase-like protein